MNNPAQISEPPVYLYTKQMELHDGMDIERLFHEAVNDLSEKIKKFEVTESGWVANSYHFSLGAFNDATHSQCNL